MFKRNPDLRVRDNNRDFKTVTYAFPLVIFTALVMSMASTISENRSYVSVKTTKESVTQDQSFTIDVSVTAHIPINAIDIVIEYPEEVLVIDGVDTGTSVITLWTEEPYARDGKIYLRGGTFRKGFLGEHKVAEIVAHARKTGEAKVVLAESALVAGDGKGTEVPVSHDGDYHEARIQILGADGVALARAHVELVSDTNGDGSVNMSDITEFMAAWLTQKQIYDFNNDGKMSFKDFSIILFEAYAH